MSSADLHQVVFIWPHTEPTKVIVTGTFDEWSSSMHLVKNATGFKGEIQIPWEQKIKYKFVVDGEWLLHEDQPTEVDPGGYVNNTYTAPAKPVILRVPEATPLPLEADKSTAVEASSHTNGNSVVAEVAEKLESAPQISSKDTTKSLTGTTDGEVAGAELKISDTETSGFPQLLSDLASTIVARHGTSSALGYVASGLGAAMHSAVGIDPINIPKIAIPTPKYNDDFTLPPDLGITSPTLAEESARDLPSSPIAPLLPITIVPVNAAENNTVTSSSPPESTHVIPRFPPESSVPVGSEAAEEKANGTAPDPVVNTPHVPEHTLEESTITDAEVTAKIPSEPVVKESAYEAIPVTMDEASGQINEAIVPPVPEVTSPGDVKPEEDLSLESKEGSSNKISAGNAVVETTVEPIPATIIEAPVDVAEPETKLIVEAKLEESLSSEPTEADLVLERATTVDIVEQTPIPVIDVPLVKLPIAEDHSVLSETSTTPAIAPIVGAEPIIPLTGPNLVTEENPQTPIPVLEIRDVQTTATGPSSNEHTTAVVTEEVAKPVPSPQITEASVPANNNGTVPTTPRKKTLTIGSVKGIQGFPSSQTDSPSHTPDNSPTSSKFNSARKKRTSIFGKIKNIFHHDKDKEKK